MLRRQYLGFGVPRVGKVLGIDKPPNRGVARGFLGECGLLVGCDDAVKVAA